MKHLLENWREYLLTEGMMDVDDLPEDVYIRIVEESSTVTSFRYVDRQGKRRMSMSHEPPWGIVRIEKAVAAPAGDGPCDGAWVVAQSAATTGWGPLLYDVAIEWATKNGNGLTADRYTVSKSAQAVWDYYLNKRGDVSDHQLDDMDNTLTSIDADNCVQKHMVTGPDASQLKKSPLSKRYTKSPDIINKLKQINKLWYPYVEFLE